MRKTKCATCRFNEQQVRMYRKAIKPVGQCSCPNVERVEKKFKNFIKNIFKSND